MPFLVDMPVRELRNDVGVGLVMVLGAPIINNGSSTSRVTVHSQGLWLEVRQLG